MNIYLSNGYLDIEKIIAPKVFHTVIFVGPRGSGKSFGVLDQIALENPQKFIYMRTMKVELDLMKIPDLNPFMALNDKKGSNFTLRKQGQYFSSIHIDNDKTSPLIGMASALSTIYHARGMDASSYKVLFYDEFIPEPHVRIMKEQYTALKGAYETLNRNRELEGEPPLKLIMCGNSDDINNDILAGYDLIDDIFKMREEGVEVKDYPERGVRVVYPFKSPIAEKKRKTANYQSDTSDYTRMALGNEFTGFYKGNIQSMNLKNYKPKVRIGNLGIYRSRSDKTFYISSCINAQFPECYNLTDYELAKFRYKYIFLNDLYLRGRIVFEKAWCEIAFINLFKK